ncbi:hypothetical protein Nmel_017338 [Mimus melanotis]
MPWECPRPGWTRAGSSWDSGRGQNGQNARDRGQGQNGQNSRGSGAGDRTGRIPGTEGRGQNGRNSRDSRARRLRRDRGAMAELRPDHAPIPDHAQHQTTPHHAPSMTTPQPMAPPLSVR